MSRHVPPGRSNRDPPGLSSDVLSDRGNCDPPGLGQGNVTPLVSAGVSRLSGITVTLPQPLLREAAEQHPQALRAPWVVLSREQEDLMFFCPFLSPEGQLRRSQ